MIPHSRSTLDATDEAAVLETIRSGLLTSGEKTEAFRNAFADFLDISNVRLCSSGSAALKAILQALDVHAGDNVLIPNYICGDVAAAVRATGATPCLYDNRADSLLSSPEQILKQTTERTKAIVVNHTFGFCFQDVETLASETGLPIIEDCCHAIAAGSLIQDQAISLSSICSFYSFNATKLLATGEGGAVASHDEAFIRRLDEVLVGRGLSDLESSLGLSQLRRYPGFLERREEIAQLYFEQMPDPLTRMMRSTPSLYFRFPIAVEDPQAYLCSDRVTFRRGVDSLLHVELGLAGDGLTHSITTYNHTISVPIFPSLTDSEVEVVIAEVSKVSGLT